MNNNLTKNTLLLSLGTIINKCLVFFMIPLFSSWLTTEDYGTFDLLCTYVTMLIPILSLSVGEGIFRFAIEEDNEKRKYYITNGFIVYLFGIILAVLAMILLLLIGNVKIIVPFCLMLCSEIIFKLLQSFLRAIKKLNVFSFFSAISTIFIFFTTTIFVKCLNLGLYGIIYGYAIGYIIGDILIALYSKFPSYITRNWSYKGIKSISWYFAAVSQVK